MLPVLHRFSLGRRLYWLAAITLCSLSLARASYANTAQDQLGAGSRNKALGGTGTASATDAFASYYNPANLSHCRDNSVSVEVAHLVYVLKTKGAVAQAALADRTALSVGACLQLPHRLSLGFAFDTGLQGALRLEQRSVHEDPIFALYGSQLETLSMMGALSYQISDKLAFGLGGAVLANSGLGVGVDVPILRGDGELAADIAWELEPRAALHVGVSYQATPTLITSLSARTPLYHKLEGEVATTVDVAGVLLDVDLLIESVAWYSPLQASLGLGYQAFPRTSVSADLTWYHWSAYPGPALHISPLDPNDTVAAGLNYPPEEPPDFSDIVVPRLGFEHMFSRALALRLGAAYRTSPAPLPSATSRANLLDGSLSTASLGFGYLWSSKKGRKAVSSFQLDMHARLQHMHEREVVKMVDNTSRDYAFGGNLFDTGVTMTMRW